MSNLNNSRINVTMTAAQVTAVKTALQTIQTNMPFLTGLTTEERQNIPKINVSNKVFVEDAINAGINNASMIPSYITIPPMQTDLQLFNQLDELLVLSRQLTEKLEDTQMLAGSEAFISGLTLYRLFEAAAEAGIPGADSVYNGLKERFTNQSPTPPSNPPTP